MQDRAPVISVMLAVADAPLAARWYADALGAQELWNLGSVIGMTVRGEPFFLRPPEGNGADNPAGGGPLSVLVELFVDDPDDVVARAVAVGADGTGHEIRDHEAP